MTEELVEKCTDAMFKSEPWSSFWSRDEARKLARACLSSIEAAGYAVVPKEPTEEMIEDARGIPISAGQAEHAFHEDCDSCGPLWMRQFFRAMLAAASKQG